MAFIAGCAKHGTEPDNSLVYVENIKAFNKAKFDWEVLVDAYASETNQIGRFESIGFNVQLHTNDVWRFYEDSSDIGKINFENLQQIGTCPKHNSWVESYNIEGKKYDMKKPIEAACRELEKYIK